MAGFWCLVPAAGRGTRVGGDRPKQYQPLAGHPLIMHTLDRLAAHPRIDGLLVILGAGDKHWSGIDTLHGKPIRTATGGAERSDSVLAGLHALPEEVRAADFVLVHDAARPCVRLTDIDGLIERATQADGGLLGAPLRDTLKRADAQGRSERTEPRDHRWRAFTPQMFRRGHLVALQEASSLGISVSDEAMAMEMAGFVPLLVEGAEDNIKVTTPADFALAEFLLEKTRRERDPIMRIGTGFDVHAFGDGDYVTLGGVRVPHNLGVIAHSDGDVVIHALCDAIFGALALGDIGQHFPPSDERWRDADSRQFLRHAAMLMKRHGYSLGNADLTVICEAPKVGPHAQAMRKNLAEDLSCDIGCISIKATTTEKLGFTGRGEGIAAQAVVLLERA